MTNNNKSNKNSCGKRSSAFLPDDILREFGNFSKKPKLDVILTPVSPHSPNKLITSNVNNESTVEDTWWEDLSEEAIEECVQLASQVCPEGNTNGCEEKAKTSTYKASSVRTTTNSSFKIPKVPKTSIPAKNVPSHSFELGQVEVERDRTVLEISNINVKKSSNDGDAFVEQIKKLETANCVLQDKCLSKEGEVSILRSHLKQLQMQLETQSIEHRKEFDAQAQKFKKELNEQKKELDVTNTQLQFQIMEATTIRNHYKLLESGARIKLKEPEAFSPKRDGTRRKCVPLKDSHQAAASTGKGQRSHKMDDKTKDFQIGQPAHSLMRVVCREGSVLGDIVNDFLFRKSSPDITWILYIRKSQSMCRSIKEAEGINSKILTLQKNERTLESCYTAVNKLISMDSLSSIAAQPFIEMIIRECQEILCRQLHILRLIFEVQSSSERVEFNGAIASSIGTLATNGNKHLMCANRWYDDEEGVESRRAVGLICALCDVSQVACDMISGAVKPNQKGDDFSQSKGNQHSEIVALIKETGPPVSMESRTMGPNNQSAAEEPKSTCAAIECVDISSPAEKVLKVTSPQCTQPAILGYSEYNSKSLGFLWLLKDLTTSISMQRRTRHFIGLLTSVVKLLNNVARSSTFNNEGVKIVTAVIQEMVFCCPQVEVITSLLELFALLSPYSTVMSSFCVNSDAGTFLEKKKIGLTYFFRETCVAQVLCRLLPTYSETLALRTELCFHLVHWLYNLLCFYSNESCWLWAYQGNVRKKCKCRISMAQSFIGCLYNSLSDLESVKDKDGTYWKLQEAVSEGVVLLRIWQHQEKEFWMNFDREQLEYQLTLCKAQTELDLLKLNTAQRDCVTELLNQEKEKHDEIAEDGIEESFWEYVSSINKITTM